MRIGRRRSRSTQTPAGRLSRMNGRNSIVAEEAELERRDVQRRRRDERQGEQRHLRPEDG